MIHHYHWISAGLFAVWVILLSLRIITKSQSIWVRVLSGAFLVNIALFALPQSFAVVLGGAIGYPVVHWLMRRNFLPSFDLASYTALLTISCFLSAIQATLIIYADPGFTLYFIRENSLYLIKLIALYSGVTIVSTVIGRVLHLRWFIVCGFSIIILFTTNAYVFTLLLLPLLLGYSLAGEAVPDSPRIGLLVLNSIWIQFFYAFMSVFTLKGIGPFYPRADAPWIIGTMLSPFLFGYGVLAWTATAN